MNYYEVIYETGNRSVISADSDEEAMRGIKEQHQRAARGESGRGASTERTDLSPGEAGYNPTVMDYPAERVARVLKYDVHPGDYGQDQTISSDEFNAAVKDYVKAKGDVVNVMDAAAFVRDLTNPHVQPESNRDSQYMMKETEELDLSELDK
jgi:hypothetical protein